MLFRIKTNSLSKPKITIPDVVPICENNVTLMPVLVLMLTYGQLERQLQSINLAILAITPSRLLIITQLFLAALKFRSTKIKHCHDNFCRYAGLDGQSKYNNRLRNGRGRF
jgi:hypothetical protein